LLDGGVEIKLVRRAGTRELAQASQRNLDVADAELDIAVEIPELAAVPDLHRAVVAVLLLADADAFGILAMRAERRGAGSADPFIAALVPALLLLEALLQRLHELVPAHGLDLLLLFLGEILLGELLQPLLGDLGLVHRIEKAFEALEHGAEHAV